MKVAKLTAEIGADIAKFRAAVREAERELLSFTKMQERLGQSAVLQNQKIAESEQKLVNASHQLLSAERNLENARHAQIKQLLGIENTQRRLAEAQAKYNKLANSETASVEAKTAALNRIKNLENNLMAQRLQLANAVNTLSKAESNYQRVQEASILQLRKHMVLEEQEKRIALQAAEAKIAAEKAVQDARNASHNLNKKQLEQEAQQRRRHEIEYTQWWEKREAQREKAEASAREKAARQEIRDQRDLERKEKLLLKERQLAEAQAYQASLMGRLSGAYNGLHKAQTFFSNSATSMTATITVPFALLAKSAFDASVQMESYRVTIENFVGSTEQANQELTKLRALAEKPGLEFEGLMKAFPRMLAVGTSTEKARFILEQFGNELGRTKAKADEIRRTFENLPQIMSMKSLVGQETMQMSRLMPSFRQGLLSLYGTAEGKELTAMGISGKKVIEDLANLFAKTARAANSTQNEVKNLTQEFFFLRAEIGDEFKKLFMELAPTIRDAMKEAVAWFKSLSPEMKKAVVQGGLFLAVLGPISGALSGFIGVARAGIGVIVGLGNAYRFVAGGIAVAKGAMTVADLATKFQAIGMASTAAAATTQAAWAVALLPFIKFIAIAAAVALAIYGLKKAWDWAVNYGIKSQQEIEAEIKLETERIKKKAEVTAQTASLAKEYNELYKKQNRTAQETAKLNELFNKIAMLNPTLVKGYNDQGLAIHGLTQDYAALEKQAKAAAEAQRISAFVDTYKPRLQANTDQLASARERLQSLLENGARVVIGYQRPTTSQMVDDGTGRLVRQQVPIPGSSENVPIYGYTKEGAEYTRQLASTKEEVRKLEEALKALKQEMQGAAKQGKNPTATTPNTNTPSTTPKVSSETSVKAVSGFTEAQLEAMAKYINTPAGQHSCGYFASQMIEAMYGVDVPGKYGIGRAGNGNGLEDWIKDKGGTRVSRKEARPGDIMFMPGNGPSGVHVGIFDGRNMIDSSGKPKEFGDRSKISFDKGIPSSARFYRVPWEQKDGQQMVQSMREQESAAEKLDRLVKSQQEKTQEILAQMQELTPEAKYQAMYAKMMADYYSEYGGLVPATLEAEVRATVEAQKKLDIWNKNLEVRRQIDDLHRQEQLAGLSERERRVVSAFGADKWYDPEVDQSKKDKFKELFNRNFDREQMQSAFKSLVDLGKQVREFYDDITGKGFKTKSQEAESQIETILKGIENSAKKANPWLQIMIAGIRKLAKEADQAALLKIFEEFDSPINARMNMLNQQMGGTFDPRAYALQEFILQNKERIAEATALAGGIDQTGRFTSKFLEGYDLEKQAEKIFGYRQQMDALNLTYQELTANSAFDVWLLRQKQWNDELKRFELPPELADPQNARNLFDAEGRNNNQQRFNSLMAETTQRMAELSANSPFERWRVSLMEMDQAGNLQPLIADFKVLQQIFADQQLMNLIEQFADGVRDIFSDMIYDIAENGFKGMFANIYAGFQKLLFKMAVEYLASVLYQSLLGSLFSGFGLGSSAGKSAGSGFVPNLGGVDVPSFAIGGPVKANQLIQVGEHGKEFFVPNADGYIVPNHVVNNLFGGNAHNSIGGSSSVSRYASSAYAVTNYEGSSANNVVNEGANTSSQIVIINHNYYGSEGSNQKSGKSVTQQVTEAQRQVDRINQRIK